MQELLRALIVDDSEHDASFLVRELQQGGFQVDFQRVDTEEGMTAALKASRWDILICDYAMPVFSGPRALAVYQKSGLDIPFFLVSGVVGEHIAVDMLKAGAHYYLKKDELARLTPAVRKELKSAKEARIRRETEATAAYLASLVSTCDEAIIGLTLDGKILNWNSGAQRLYGYTASEMLGCTISCLLPSYRPQDLMEKLELIKAGESVEDFETVHFRKGLIPVEVLVKLSAIRDPENRVIGASAIVKDITERKVEESERLTMIQDLTAALAKANSITGKL